MLRTVEPNAPVLVSIPSGVESGHKHYFKHYMKTEDTGIHNTLYLGASRKAVTVF